MIASDSLPIQFWGMDELTYNETENPYPLETVLFEQEFDITDPIKLQFTGIVVGRLLLGLFQDGVMFDNFEFDENSGASVLQFSRDFLSSGGIGPFVNDAYPASELNQTANWVNTFPARASISQIASAIVNTKVLSYPLGIKAGRNTISIHWAITNEASVDKVVTLVIYMKNATSNQTVVLETSTGITSSFDSNITNFAFDSVDDFDKIGVAVTVSAINASFDVLIYSISVNQLIDHRYDLYEIMPTTMADKCLRAYVINGDTADTSKKLIAPSAWTDPGPSFTSRTGTQFIHDMPLFTSPSATASQPIITPAGSFIRFYITVVISGTFAGSAGAFCTFSLDSGNGYSASSLQNGTYTFYVEAGSEFGTSSTLTISVGCLRSSGSCNIQVTIPVDKFLFLDLSSALKKSDCLLFSTEPESSTLISYSTSKDFDSVISETSGQLYNIRVPGLFYAEKRPTVQKSFETSNSLILNTFTSLKRQKLLLVDDCPYYMHNKIESILMFCTSGIILIEGVQWTKEEDYSYLDSRPEVYPMQAAQIYLTRKKYSKHNVI